MQGYALHCIVLILVYISPCMNGPRVKNHCSNFLTLSSQNCCWHFCDIVQRKIDRSFGIKKMFYYLTKTMLKARFHIPFTHAFTALRCFFLLLTFVCWCLWKKSYYFKTQRNAENEWGNRMWQLGLTTNIFWSCKINSNCWVKWYDRHVWWNLVTF